MQSKTEKLTVAWPESILHKNPQVYTSRSKWCRFQGVFGISSKKCWHLQNFTGWISASKVWFVRRHGRSDSKPPQKKWPWLIETFIILISIVMMFLVSWDVYNMYVMLYLYHPFAEKNVLLYSPRVQRLYPSNNCYKLHKKTCRMTCPIWHLTSSNYIYAS